MNRIAPRTLAAFAILLAAPIAGAQVLSLQSGQGARDLTGYAKSYTYFRIRVPNDASYLIVQTRGGRGDVDLYLRHASQPTTALYDYRSVGKTTEERLHVRKPKDGWWHVLVYGYTSYRDVEILTRTDGSSDDDSRDDRVRRLTSGRRVDDLRARRADQRLYAIAVPSGAESLTVETTGGDGDVDVYLSRDARPTTGKYEKRSTGKWTQERIVIDRPARGTWYVLLHAYRDYRDVSLRATVAEGDRWNDKDDPWDDKDDRWDDHWDDTDDRWDGDWNNDRDERVRVLSPESRDTWRAGQRVGIRWSASSDVRYVRIQYSLDDGRTWSARGLPAAVRASEGSYTVRLAERDNLATSRARIRITDYHDADVYDVSERFVIAAPESTETTEGEADRFESDDSRIDAVTVRLGELQRRTIHPRRDEDWIRFVPDREGTYYFSVPDTNVELRAEVWANVAGREKQLSRHQDIREGASIKLVADERTRYFKIRLWGEEFYSTGLYAVKVTAADGHGRDDRNRDRRRRPRRRVGDRHEPDNTAAAARTVSLGDLENRSLHEGDQDWMTFRPTSTGIYSLTVTSDIEIEGEIYAIRRGREVRIRSFDVDDGDTERILFAVSSLDRDIRIRIEPDDDDESGDYSILVNQPRLRAYNHQMRQSD